jgi:hypothetical protein
MNVEVRFFISFFRCIRHATFFSSLIGTMSNERRTRRQNKIHLTSFYPSATVSYFAITSLSPRHLSVWIFFIIQPITVFKLKANENNPHS